MGFYFPFEKAAYCIYSYSNIKLCFLYVKYIQTEKRTYCKDNGNFILFSPNRNGKLPFVFYERKRKTENCFPGSANKRLVRNRKLLFQQMCTSILSSIFNLIRAAGGIYDFRNFEEVYLCNGLRSGLQNWCISRKTAREYILLNTLERKTVFSAIYMLKRA